MTDSFNKAINNKRMEHWSFMPSDAKIGDTVIVAEMGGKGEGKMAFEAAVVGKRLHSHGPEFRSAGFPVSFVTELVVLNWVDRPKVPKPKRYRHR